MYHVETTVETLLVGLAGGSSFQSFVGGAELFVHPQYGCANCGGSKPPGGEMGGTDFWDLTWVLGREGGGEGGGGFFVWVGLRIRPLWVAFAAVFVAKASSGSGLSLLLRPEHLRRMTLLRGKQNLFAGAA